MVAGMNASKSRELLSRLIGMLKLWNWKHEWDARVVAALVIATFIQTLWRWRPLVSITGPSDSGKTTLFQELLLGIFLEWTIWSDRSTEAGLRQAIAQSAAPVLLDEFDKYQHRQRVLELFRTSSRGGKVLRGTADQTGQQFGLRHIGWFAGTELGLIWGPDRNRFIQMELRLPEGRTISLPGASELGELGRELAAAALWAAPRAKQLADEIKSTVIAGVHGRLIESFSVPAAMFAVMWHGREATEGRARSILNSMLRDRETLQDQGEPDEKRLIQDILGANVRVTTANGIKDLSIGQLLENYGHYRTDLEAKGIHLVRPRGSGQSFLFVVPAPVLRFLLKDTRWQGACIDQILLRVDGAKRDQQRCHSSRPWGVAIPWPLCLDRLGHQDAEQDNANPAG
jgi:hypothetical protein